MNRQTRGSQNKTMRAVVDFTEKGINKTMNIEMMDFNLVSREVEIATKEEVATNKEVATITMKTIKTAMEDKGKAINRGIIMARDKKMMAILKREIMMGTHRKEKMIAITIIEITTTTIEVVKTLEEAVMIEERIEMQAIRSIRTKGQ